MTRRKEKLEKIKILTNLLFLERRKEELINYE